MSAYPDSGVMTPEAMLNYLRDMGYNLCECPDESQGIQNLQTSSGHRIGAILFSLALIFAVAFDIYWRKSQ